MQESTIPREPNEVMAEETVYPAGPSTTQNQIANSTEATKPDLEQRGYILIREESEAALPAGMNGIHIGDLSLTVTDASCLFATLGYSDLTRSEYSYSVLASSVKGLSHIGISEKYVDSERPTGYSYRYQSFPINLGNNNSYRIVNFIKHLEAIAKTDRNNMTTSKRLELETRYAKANLELKEYIERMQAENNK